jgi:hypothetical protein
MIGGDFSQDERNELSQLGFDNDGIELIEHNIPNINLVKMSLQQINPETGNTFTPQELVQNIQDAINNDNNDDLNISGISNASDDEHDLPDFDDNNLDNSLSMNTTRENNSFMNESIGSIDNQSNGSLHLSDLNDEHEDDQNNSVNTTREDNSFGGKTRKGRKSRKSKKTKKSKKSKKSRKQRGGTCYGNGVGSNNYDPNFSIYSTRELQLFPYKPDN